MAEELRGDELLAESVARSGRVILAVLFFLAEGDQEPAPAGAPERHGIDKARFGEAVSSPQPWHRRPPRATGVIGALEPIAAGAAGTAAVNVTDDADGKTRRVFGAIDYGERYYMPLGLAMALRRLGASDGAVADATYVVGQTEMTAGVRTLPVSPRGEMVINYLGRGGTLPTVSAADVLDGTVGREALAGKLVFVGLTDVARDTRSTPLDVSMPGVELHATLAHNILHGELLRRTGPGFTLWALLALGGLVSLMQLRALRTRRAWAIGVAALGIIAAYVVLAHGLFVGRGIIVDLAAPVAAALAATLAAMTTTLATEGREKAQLRAAFSQYVSTTLVDRILTDPYRATLGGERRELTVLFSDIRGFSAFSEKLEPEALSAYLNEYLTPMTELVMADGGMLDKYIGDAVMAVYGAPLDQVDHAERACRSALAMLEALDPLNARWRERRLPVIAVGIGINSGPMSVGNMGSEARFDYTVLGDAVNLGARLEGLTKHYHVDVLVGPRTAELAAGGFVFRELDWVRVKGRAGVASIHELVGARGGVTMTDADLALFGEALAAYRAGDWDAAEAGFSAFVERHPADGPAHVMRGRVRELRLNPPEGEWDGVYEQLTK